MLRSDGQFRSLLDTLPAGAYTCDPDGLITYFNPHAVQLWGRAPRLNDPADRFCGSFRLFSADGSPIAHDQCWMALALKTRKGYIGQEIIVERPDGQRFTVLAHANPIHDDSGTLIGAVNVLVDISERRLVEEEMRRTNQTLTTLVHASPVPIVVIDHDPPTVRLWNPAAERLFGWSQEEVVGQRLPLLSEEKLAECRAHVVSASHDEPFSASDTIHHQKHGTPVEVSLSAGPLHDADGNVGGILLVFADVTEQRHAEETLRKADRAKNEFLATLAHELRNPLTPIRNAVQILRLRGSPSPELQWALGVIDRQLGQMTRLIEDLLDIARITGNKLSLRSEQIELTEVLHLAVETSRPLFEVCAHQFLVTAPSQKIYLNGDTTRLAQVISNLLNNAAKYSGRGGRIWLTAERQGGEAVISVRDTGIGIPADMLPRIFEMFSQLDRPPDQLKSGLGIGLTLVKRLVEMHGGTIAARSDGPDKGSEFIVRLPIVTGPQLSVKQRSRAGEELTNGRSLRVLVVDDNHDSAASLGMLLEILGNSIRIAHDGLEAVEMAEGFRPHVVLLDIGLPKIDGYVAARRIREQPWGKGIVLVATTGWGLDTDRQRSREAGFDHHLVKPVDPAIVAQILASLEPAVLHCMDRSLAQN